MTGALHEGLSPAPPARRPLAGTQTGPARWVLALAVFSAVMGAALGLRGVLLDFSWLLQAAVVVGGTLIIPALLRRYPLLGPFAPVGALAGWVMSLTLVFFPGTALLGVIPTPETLQAALALASEASTVIMSSNTPVPSGPPMFFLICAGLGFAALLIDTLAITVAMPAASALALVLIMLPSALTTRSGIGTLGFIGAAAGFLLILGCCRWYAPEGKLRTGTLQFPTGTLSRAVTLGAAVVLLMTLVPAAIPGFTHGIFPQGSRLGGASGTTRLDPMITLGNDLREQSAEVTMTYLSNTQDPQYLRLSTLEDFSGKVWQPSPLPSGLGSTLSGLAPAWGPSPALPVTQTVTQISIASLDDDWLPAPLSATQIDKLRGRWLWNPSTQTFKGQNSSTADQQYVVHSEVPTLTTAALAAATTQPRADLDPIYSTLPKDTPKLISSTAQEVAKKASTPYAKAMALQDYLRSGSFTYSLTAPAAEGYDGSGMEVLAKFLKDKSGYCVHFSAAMAVMARELGIPSRIAVGYAPGGRTLEVGELDGQKLLGYQATGRDAHAWPELYFEGLGWVPFEPTPSRGAVPAYAQDANISAAAPENFIVPRASAAPSLAPTATESTAAASSSSAHTAPTPGRWLLRTATVLAAALLLGLPALLRVHLRRRRLAQVRGLTGVPSLTRARGSGTAELRTAELPEVLAWRELVATAIDLGYSFNPALTPALQAKNIAALLGPTTPAALALVLHAYEKAVYGAGQVTTVPDSGAVLEASSALVASAERDDLAEAVELLNARLSTAATPWQRIRATLMPASLVEKTLSQR